MGSLVPTSVNLRALAIGITPTNQAPVSQFIYLNSATGSDSNLGTSADKPWQTLVPLVNILQNTVAPYIVTDITPGGGTYSIPDVDSYRAILSFKSTGALFEEFGPDISLVGVFIDAGYGTLTVNTVSTFTVNQQTVTRITVTGTPFPTTSYGLSGFRVRILTGASTGQCATIGSSLPANNYVQLAFGNISLSPGDTFVIERAASKFVYNGTTASLVGFDGGKATILMYGWVTEFAMATSEPDTLFTNGVFMLSGCEINCLCSDLSSVQRVRITSAHICSAGHFGVDFEELPSSYPIQPNFNEGLFIHDTAIVVGVYWNGGLSAGIPYIKVILGNASLNLAGPLSLFGNCFSHLSQSFAGGVAVSIDTSLRGYSDGTGIGTGFSGFITIFPSDNGLLDGVHVTGHSATAQFYSLNIADGYGGTVSTAGLLVEQGARAQCENVTGTSAAIGGVGIQLARGALLDCDDANTGTTIVGGSGAVIVGANSVTTQTLIAAGATANVTDIGASHTQFCAITI
jgi:hypothetical protein